MIGFEVQHNDAVLFQNLGGFPQDLGVGSDAGAHLQGDGARSIGLFVIGLGAGQQAAQKGQAKGQGNVFADVVDGCFLQIVFLSFIYWRQGRRVKRVQRMRLSVFRARRLPIS